MDFGKKRSTGLLASIAIVCIVAACLSLAACGGTGAPSAASSSSTASSEAASSAAADSGSGSAASSSGSAASSSGSVASSSGSAASSTDQFVGTWKFAAAEMQGITMGGNFGELAGTGSGGDMVINADGTGTLDFGESSGTFTWAAEGADSFYLTMQSETGPTTQQAIPVTYKDNALFVPLEQDGQQVTAIFTKDGNYAGAKQITLEGAQPITTESTLLGTWTLVGMNMGGVSMYGDAQSMSAVMGSAVSTVTFKEGGVVEMDSGEGSWAVTADGATMTSTDIMGTNTIPVVMIGDEIALDYSAAFQGQPFIVLMTRS